MDLNPNMLLDATALRDALMLSERDWRNLLREFEGLGDAAQEMAETPLLKKAYEERFNAGTMGLHTDVRSAVALLIHSALTPSEVRVFEELDLGHQMTQGLVLTSRIMRERAPSIPGEIFVKTLRMQCFGEILRAVGQDLIDPKPVFEKILDRLHVLPEQRMSLLSAAVANSKPRTGHTLH
ncbi:hypothetical protein LUCX_82 [Xanthomonas phage vB_XciM_LucasX]|nr:hypothetical protein LUCX_82 [Xanthomonas phage vB_XciM_LucasX]